jgi:hypothetical protein
LFRLQYQNLSVQKMSWKALNLPHIALSIPGMNAEAFRAGKGKRYPPPAKLLGVLQVFTDRDSNLRRCRRRKPRRMRRRADSGDGRRIGFAGASVALEEFFRENAGARSFDRIFVTMSTSSGWLYFSRDFRDGRTSSGFQKGACN